MGDTRQGQVKHRGTTRGNEKKRDIDKIVEMHDKERE